MTRCYEFYCMVLKNPEFCEGKGDRIVDYIDEYIIFMQAKGINFDRTPDDKARFYAMQQKYGSERMVTRTQLKEEDLTLPIEPHHGAEGISTNQAPIHQPTQIQPSLSEKSVEKCSVCPEPIDMGKIFHCDICKKDYTIIHVDEGKHRFEQVTVG